VETRTNGEKEAAKKRVLLRMLVCAAELEVALPTMMTLH
jgi:hypothetical protein